MLLDIGHTLRGCVDWNREWRRNRQGCPVTPCVGVWIETMPFIPIFAQFMSHPAWVCGLKRSGREGELQLLCHTLRGCVDWNRFSATFIVLPAVTPCVGVWIETFQRWRYSVARMSHPAWVCGLKHQ